MHSEVATPWYHTIRFRLVAAALVVEVIMLALLLANSYRLMNDSFESQTRVRIEALADQTFDTSTKLSLFGNPVGSARFGLSLGDQIALRDANLQQSFAIVLAAILLSVFLLMAAGYLITRHIASLAAATCRIASADFQIESSGVCVS